MAELDTVRETELKLTVPPDADLGVLLAAGGTVAAVGEPSTAELSSTYFDTADLRLAREGITLRERTGDDEGWHLKVPAGAEGRHEIRAELGGSTPPAALLDLVRAFTRGEPVARVATLATTRVTRQLLGGDGEVLGVVVDDAVRVLDGDRELSRFREIEVEADPAVADPTPLLSEVTDRLVTAGATLGEQLSKAVRALGPAAQQPPSPPRPEPGSPTDPAATAITAHLRTQTRALMRHDLGVRRDLPDAVQQMRVAARRWGSTLRTFRPLLAPGADLEWLSDELAWAADVLGNVRDRELLLARLQGHISELPLSTAEQASLTTFVTDQLGAELVRARADVLNMLGSDRYRLLVERLIEVATAPPLVPAAGAPAVEVLPELVESAAMALQDRAGRLTPDSADVAFHRARITAKHARYAGELTVPLLGQPAKTYTEAAEAVEEVLRELQNSALAEEVVRRLAADAPPAVAAGLDALADFERTCASSARAAFAPIWSSTNALLPQTDEQ